MRTEFRSRQNDWKPVVLAIVLMVTGTVLVGGDALGLVSLDRIQSYWPLALIVMGLAGLVSEPRQSAPCEEEHARRLWQ